jgi:hypothetical protein
MRDFARTGFVLRQAPRPLRLVYAAFLALVAPGVLTQVVFQVGRVGLTPSAITAYYRGDDTGTVLSFGKTAAQLLEVTHAHAFTMSVVFLILAHLYAACPGPARLRGLVVGATFVGMLGDLTGPWLVRYGSPWCAWLMLVSWVALDAGAATMLLTSGWECLGYGPCGKTSGLGGGGAMRPPSGV